MWREKRRDGEKKMYIRVREKKELRFLVRRTEMVEEV